MKTLALAVALITSIGGVIDWPQWRGPFRTGRVAAEVTSMWPGTLRRAWSVEVGEGHASPIFSGGRVYVHARRGGDEVVSVLDVKDGGTIWSQRHAVAYTPVSAAAGHGAGPKATPLLHQGRLYTFGAGGALSAFDAGTGRLVWRRDFATRFKQARPLFGVAQSPVADGDRIIVHAGGSGGSALLAVDAATGADVWAFTAYDPAYASPMVTTIAEVRQVVTLTEKHVVGVSAADGSLLWSFPFTTVYDQNAVTPLIHGSLVIVSGIESGVTALRVAKDGARFSAKPAWKSSEASFYMSSPVLALGDRPRAGWRDTRLIGFSHRQKGQIVALDADSGRLLWASPGRQGESASIVVADGFALVMTTEGELLVVRYGGDAFAPITRYTVADTPVWAHLAPITGGVLVKDVKTLTLWSVRLR
jgi:outer membrane protein assembly factor BamB